MKRLSGLLLLLCLALSAQAQLLWKISGKGLEKSSYVFGTYHLSPLSITDSIAAMPQALKETTQVYGEVVMADMANPAMQQEMQQKMLLPQDTTLQSLFTPEAYEQVGKAVSEHMKADIALMAKLKPAIINQQLGILFALKHTPGFNPQQQLDTYFQQQAQQQGKKVGGLESIQSQIDFLFNSQSLQRQAQLLHCTVSNLERTVEQLKKVIASYNAQDLNGLLQAMEERYNDACDPLPGEMEALLDRRNQAWIEKMPAIMTDAPTLFVVGAGHLPGEQGVLHLLKQKGYTVEPMK